MCSVDSKVQPDYACHITEKSIDIKFTTDFSYVEWKLHANRHNVVAILSVFPTVCHTPRYCMLITAKHVKILSPLVKNQQLSTYSKSKY